MKNSGGRQNGNQELVYDYIAGHIARHGVPPEQKKICEEFQLFRTTVSDYIAALERKGLITRKGRGFKNNIGLVK